MLQAQWHSLKGPYGGYINNSVNSGTSSYVSTLNGLYRSDDDGKHWMRLDNGLPEFHNAISFCANKDEVFLCYSDYITNEIGFVYSNDQGLHWIKRALPAQNWSKDQGVEMIYSDGILVATGDQELIESYDKGISWNSAHLKNPNSEFGGLSANHTHIFISNSYHSVLKRAIRDTNWITIYTSPDYCYLTHVTDSLLVILKDRAPGVRSIDNGLSWQTMSIEGNGSIADFGDSLYLPYYGDIYKSTDKGLNWNLIKSFQNNSFSFFDTWRFGNSLFGEAAALLIRTENEFNTFESSSTGIFAANGDRILVTDSFLFVSTNATIERYDLLSKKWNDKSLLIGEYVEDLYYLQKRLFAVMKYGDSIYISPDQGISYHKVFMPLLQIPDRDQNVKLFEFGNKIIASSYNEIDVSNDNGETWEELICKDSLGNIILPNELILLDQQLILAGRLNHSQKTSYFTSADLNNWSLLSLNFPNNSGDYLFQEFQIAGNELFFNLNNNYTCNLYKYNPNTHDLIACNGLSSICNNSLDNHQKMIANKNYMLFNTEQGYYKSDDGGLNWIRIVDELNNSTYSLFYDFASKDQTIYVTSAYFGVLQTNWDDLKFKKVEGFIYYDKDNNDLYDGNDEALNDAFVRLKHSYQYFPTDHNGNFHFSYASALSDTLIPIYHTKHGYFNPVQLSFHAGDTTLQFAYKFPNNIEDASVFMYDYPRPRPGFIYYLDVLLKNQGSDTCSGDLNLTFDGIFEFDSSTILPDTRIGNSLTWKIAGLNSLDEQKIRIALFLPANIALNTEFQHHLSFTNISLNDADLSDNDFYIAGKVFGSHDPNEMTVDKISLSKEDLKNKPSLTYTIYFQNTGNHEAEIVKLYDDLSNFDLNTFHIIASSHPFTYDIDESGRMHVLYDMIHLPDSLSSESNSHGYFSYTIAPRPDRIYNNAITNQASIYFDFNSGISTNTAITKIQDFVDSKNPVSPNNEPLLVIPNPNNGRFILLGKRLETEAADVLKIYNLQGQCVYDIKDKFYPGYQMNLDQLNPGLYYLKLGISNAPFCKFIIQM